MCLAKLFANQPYICTVNPVLGHEIESEYHITPAVRKKKVIVVGGGLSGLECAITASQRGHEVTLYEKRGRLGGQVLSASREVKGGEELLRLLEYYENQIKKNHIKVVLGVKFSKDICREELPDVVVLATGATLLKPAIKGIENPIVSTAFELLEANLHFNGKKVVVIEGGKTGLITAEHCASQGNQVWIVTGEKRVDKDVSPTFKWRHAAWVKEFNIKIFTETRITEIHDHGIKMISTKGENIWLEADLVIVAGPRKPVQRLFTELEYLADELYLIGDAVMPRSMHTAIQEGYKLGVRI